MRRAWLGPPVSALAASLPPDPLRTRMAFLGALGEDERHAFLEAAEARMAAQLEQAGAYEAGAAGDPFDVLVSEGAIVTIRSRLEWIRAARQRVVRGAGPLGARRRAD